MNFVTIRTFWTKTKHVILTNFVVLTFSIVKGMKKIAIFHANLAEASLIIGTVFLFLVAHSAHLKNSIDFFRLGMLIQAVISFLAFSMLLPKPTNRDSIFTKNVQEFALAALLAGVLHPVNTHALLALVLVDCVIEGI